ncbi:MAG: hypothetical protein ACLUDU_07960 [Butyricimonas faecihominis]
MLVEKPFGRELMGSEGLYGLPTTLFQQGEPRQRKGWRTRIGMLFNDFLRVFVEQGCKVGSYCLY